MESIQFWLLWAPLARFIPWSSLFLFLLCPCILCWTGDRKRVWICLFMQHPLLKCLQWARPKGGHGKQGFLHSLPGFPSKRWLVTGSPIQGHISPRLCHSLSPQASHRVYTSVLPYRAHGSKSWDKFPGSNLAGCTERLQDDGTLWPRISLLGICSKEIIRNMKRICTLRCSSKCCL